MAKCISCGKERLDGKRVCSTCISNWANMRGAIFQACENRYGKLNPSNHAQYIADTKRLEKIWRKDKEKFQIELTKLKGGENG